VCKQCVISPGHIWTTLYIACLVECSKWWHTEEPVVFKGLTELNVTLISFLKLVYNISGGFVSGLRFSGLWRRITGWLVPDVLRQRGERLLKMTPPRCLESSSTAHPLARRHICLKSTAARACRNLHSFVAAITLLYYWAARYITALLVESLFLSPSFPNTVTQSICISLWNVRLLSESDALRLVVILAPVRWLQHTNCFRCNRSISCGYFTNLRRRTLGIFYTSHN
jgi:hypothetical protein